MVEQSASDLIAFLVARLDEAEAHARKDLWIADRASGGGKWEAHYGYNLPYSEVRAAGVAIGRLTAMLPWPGGRPDGAEDQHQKDVALTARMASAARPRAERMLRDVAADRKLIAAYEDAAEFSDPWIGLDLAVRIRAGRFSDHPEYRREWAP
jgi:hypothetical protein